MKLAYFVHNFGGVPHRLYYYPELSARRKAIIFSRFATFSIPLQTTGNRYQDRKLAKEIVESKGYNWEDLQKGHHIHHHPKGDRLEWIPIEVHRVPHCGGIHVKKRGDPLF